MTMTTEATWTIDNYHCHVIQGKHCWIWIAARPSYCDRGNWIAHVDVRRGTHPQELSVDVQDGWPRYYFDLDRAKAECEAWLEKRREATNAT